MNKHTPGPWKVNINSIESGRYKFPEIVHETHEGSIVQDVICTSLAWQWRAREEEHWANAQLLAASPQLLEACKTALNYLVNGLGLGYDEDGEETPEVLALRQAIAAAEQDGVFPGKSHGV